MKKILLSASALCLMLAAQAQFTYDYLRAADDYYRKADYYSAAQYYEKYLDTKGDVKTAQYDPYVVKSLSEKQKKAVSSKEQAVYNLAESYRQLNYYVKAEPFYQQAISFDGAKYPLAAYHYATTLRALGKFDEAEKAFQQFLSGYTAKDNYAEAAAREIENLRFIQAQLKRKDLNQYKVAAAEAFSAEGANYAPVWISPTTVYFTTTRPEGSGAKKEYINKIYEAAFAGTGFSAPAKVNIPQPGDLHQGGVAISADGNTMFLTRWTVGEGKKAAASIYVSQKTGAGWSEPVQVKGLSVAGATDKQPFVTEEGKLLFASDRVGGLGGFDLWSATVNASDEASNITNLGPAINTAFDEEAPYFHAPSKTLVFSTNGRVGMGGFDLFFTTEKNGAWSTPENFGYPVNSVKNDLYFASHGKAILQDVLLSSDRAAECCLQLFTLSKVKNPKLIAGTVVDCKTNQVLPNAVVEAKGAGNQSVFKGSTSGSGTYTFKLDEFQPLQITASLNGYTPNSIKAPVPSNENAEDLTAPVLCLDKVPEVGVAVILDNVYYAFNKATVLEESYAALDKLAEMLKANPNVAIEISGHTDSKGADDYNMKLSEARAQSVVDYLASQGIDTSRLVAKGYGETKPIAPNTNPDGSDNPEGREKNRRTEFKVIRN